MSDIESSYRKINHSTGNRRGRSLAARATQVAAISMLAFTFSRQSHQVPSTEICSPTHLSQNSTSSIECHLAGSSEITYAQSIPGLSAKVVEGDNLNEYVKYTDKDGNVQVIFLPNASYGTIENGKFNTQGHGVYITTFTELNVLRQIEQQKSAPSLTGSNISMGYTQEFNLTPQQISSGGNGVEVETFKNVQQTRTSKGNPFVLSMVALQ